MGCCQSSLEDSEERRPILQSGTVPPGGSSVTDQPTSSVHSPTTPKSDEQSKLNHILQRTTQSIINVAADIPTIEQDESIETSKLYSQKIGRSGLRFTKPYRLPSVQAPVQTVLAAPPPLQAELDMVIAAAEKSSQYKSKIAVIHKEELVVPFGVP